MAARGPDGKFIAPIKMEENSSSRTTPTPFSTESPAPGSSARVQQAKDAVGAAARLVKASSATAAIGTPDVQNLATLEDLEAEMTRREAVLQQEADRQATARQLLHQQQQHADSRSQVAPEATSREEEARLRGRDDQAADLQRRAAILSQREDELAASARALAQEGGNIDAGAAHSMSSAPSGSSRRFGEAASAGGHRMMGHGQSLEDGNDMLAALLQSFRSSSGASHGSSAAPEPLNTFPGMSSAVTKAVARMQLPKIDFDSLSSSPERMRAMRTLLERICSLYRDVSIPGLSARVVTALQHFVLVTTNINET